MLSFFHPESILQLELDLPASKSISNRLLMLKSLYRPGLLIENLSNARDVELMEQAVSLPAVMDVKDAGTVMRFMLAFAAVSTQEVQIIGSKRMAQRPNEGLIMALRSLGADIQTKGDSFFPVKVKGKKLAMKGPLDMRRVPSSQFISALLMIAPGIGEGFELQIDEGIPSEGYVNMTLALMHKLGFQFKREPGKIQYTGEVPYSQESIHVEPDLTSAMYWYALAACSKQADILLRDLPEDSIQPERTLLNQLKGAGVSIAFTDRGLHLVKERDALLRFPDRLEFKDNPDSAATILIMLALCSRKKYQISGLESLNLKESKREDHLKSYLKVLGAKLNRSGEEWQLDCTDVVLESGYAFRVYEDHRMAMSLAPLALISKLTLDKPEVVNKSYPGFWQDLKKANFVLHTQ